MYVFYLLFGVFIIVVLTLILCKKLFKSFCINFNLMLGLILFGAGLAIPQYYFSSHAKLVPAIYQYDKIYAFQDNLTVQGEVTDNVFITKGYVGTELSYFYLTDSDDGSGYIQKSIPASKVVIKETDGEPRLEVTGMHFEDEWLRNNIGYIDVHNTQTIIYLPKSSISRNYNLDLK